MRPSNAVHLCDRSPELPSAGESSHLIEKKDTSLKRYFKGVDLKSSSR